MRIIELFAGLGSQTQALVNLGMNHEVAAISEIDRYALISYEALHRKPNNLGDITKIAELPQAELWTYSFPCQDISLAGKQAGIKDGTRSGLLFEVERLLRVAAEKGTLPKYLLLENVKNLVGKRFRADFDSWLSFLSDLGYTNYWQVLNTRDYCIPQNRERVFCVSIRGEHTPYKFPEKRHLRLRLKDMLDTEVEERYYLSEQALSTLLNATYNQERERLQNPNGAHRTLCARDYKSPTVVPTCRQAGKLTGGKWDKMHDISKRVYETDGISPTLHCAGGGNTEPKIIDDTYRCREPRVYGKIAPTIRSAQTFKVTAGQFQPINRDYKADGEPRAEHFECRKDEIANAVLTGDRKNCIRIAALGEEPNAEIKERFFKQAFETLKSNDCKHGDTIDAFNRRVNKTGVSPTLTNRPEGFKTAILPVIKDPKIIYEEPLQKKGWQRKACEVINPDGICTCIHTQSNNLLQKITEPIICAMRGRNPDNPKSRKAGIPTVQKLETGGYVSNTLTTVQKDNLVAEPKETFVGRGYKDFVNKKGYFPEIFNAYNRSEIKQEAPTVTTQCGSVTSSSGILKAETDKVSKTVRVGGHGWHYKHTWDVIQANTRIRKLTPWECLRLQGWRDSEISKIRSAGISNTQAYRQAGNGITVTVLMAIFGELFNIPYKELLDNWSY